MPTYLDEAYVSPREAEQWHAWASVCARELHLAPSDYHLRFFRSRSRFTLHERDLRVFPDESRPFIGLYDIASREVWVDANLNDNDIAWVIAHELAHAAQAEQARLLGVLQYKRDERTLDEAHANAAGWHMRESWPSWVTEWVLDHPLR